MKTFTLSNKTVPTTGSNVGTVQATGTENSTYSLKNPSQPADYSDASTSPTVQPSGTAPVARRRRPLMLIAS